MAGIRLRCRTVERARALRRLQEGDSRLSSARLAPATRVPQGAKTACVVDLASLLPSHFAPCFSHCAPTRVQDATYYSLPGRCASSPFWEKDYDECARAEPGGECPPGVLPDGIACTWSLEVLGFVHVDELSGIRALGYSDHADFCQREGGVNGVAREINGGRVCFWNDFTAGVAHNSIARPHPPLPFEKQLGRMTTLESLFYAKYPEQGTDRPPPRCPF